VAKIREAIAIANEGNDPSVQITLKAILSHALWLSGRLREALQINVEATERAHEIVKVDRQTLGFEPEIWLAVLRGRTLVMMGRREEAEPILDRILQLEPGQVNPVDHIMPSWAYVDLAWAEGNVALAREHADRALVIAMNSGNPYLRVYAQACRGLSHIVAGQLGSAIEDLSEALRFARSRKAGLENEPRILADLANAYRLNGDAQTALSTVIEAIGVATERNSRVSECLARIVHAKLLLAGTSNQKMPGDSELEHARALMQETGAVIFKPMFESSIDGQRDAQPAAKAN
jgi:adenylate cyclase